MDKRRPASYNEAKGARGMIAYQVARYLSYSSEMMGFYEELAKHTSRRVAFAIVKAQIMRDIERAWLGRINAKHARATGKAEE